MFEVDVTEARPARRSHVLRKKQKAERKAVPIQLPPLRDNDVLVDTSVIRCFKKDEKLYILRNAKTVNRLVGWIREAGF